MKTTRGQHRRQLPLSFSAQVLVRGLFCFGIVFWLGLGQAAAEVANPRSANFTIQGINFGQSIVLPITGLGTPKISSGPLVSNVTESTVTITWKTDQETTSIVQFGLATSYGTDIGDSLALRTDHTVTISNLGPETVYHFRVRSVNAEGDAGVSSDQTFTTTAKRGITSISVSDVTYTSALVSWQTGDATSSELQYGTTVNYGQSIKDRSLSFTTGHAAKLEHLSPGVEYHFRIVSVTNNGQIDRSNDFSFKTIAEPSISGIKIVAKSAHEVDVIWQTNTPTSAIVSYTQQGKTRQSAVTSSTFVTDHTMAVTDLLDDTVYTFRVTVTDTQGRQVTSAEVTFRTPIDPNPPVISNLRVNVTRSGDQLVATITWTTTKLTRGKATIFQKSDASKAIELPSEQIPSTGHVLVKPSLSPNTLYRLVASSADNQGAKEEKEINFITPTLRKGILGLILDSFAQSFGWLTGVFGQ